MPDLAARPPLCFRGVPAERHETLASTNDEAFRRAAEGAPDGLVVTASHQTHGRGRLGRAWWDSPGTSILASVLLRPVIPLPTYPLLGMAMACAVAGAAERFVPGERFDVKWPNDVLHRGRKLCGILAETRVPGPSATPTLVIGFGVNLEVAAQAWPGPIREIATSMRAAAGDRTLDAEALLREVLRLFDLYASVATAEEIGDLWTAVVMRLPKPGTHVTVTTRDRALSGTIVGYGATGAIQLRDALGEVHNVTAGEIPLDGGEAAP